MTLEPPHSPGAPLATPTVETVGDLFRHVFENTSDLITVKDREGRYVFANGQTRRFFGCEPSQVIGRTVFDLYGLEAGRAIAASDARVLESGGEVRYEQNRVVSGQECCFLVNKFAYRDATGAVAGVVSICHDLTDRRRAEAAERQNEAKYRTVMENVAEGIAMVDPAEVFVFANPAADRIFGLPTGGLVGRSLAEFIDEATFRVMKDQTDARRSGHTSTFDHQLLKADGTKGHVLVTSSPQFDANGTFTGTFAIFRDISAMRAAQEELRRAKESAEEAAQLKSSFLASITHELRTPLNAAIGHSRLLMRTKLDERQAVHAASITSAASMLLALIDELLDFSKLEAGRLEPRREAFDPVDCLREAGDLAIGLAVGRPISVVREVAPGVEGRVFGDQQRVRQVLVNLASNAVKFTERGSVKLSLAPATGFPVPGLRFEVRDSGIGIPPERHNRLFQSFSQLHTPGAGRPRGTGLGLALSKGLVDLMGGRIGFESQPGEGSLFWFEIPAPRAEPAGGQQTVPTAVGDSPDLAVMDRRRRARVLVADDDESGRRLVAEFLRVEGFEGVRVVSDGGKAVEEFARAPADLVLLDLQMPILDGFAAARAIRSLPSGEACLIAALSAATQTQDLARDREAGFDRHCPKPVDLDALVEALDAHLAGYPETSMPAASRPEAPRTQDSECIEPIRFARIDSISRGDASFAASYLRTFLEGTRRRIDEFRAFDGAFSDLEKLRRLSHQLRGSSANAGAEGLARLAGELEAAALSGNAEILAQRVQDLLTCWLLVERAILERIDKDPPA